MSRKTSCPDDVLKRVTEFEIDPESVSCTLYGSELTIEACHDVSDLPGVKACARVTGTPNRTKNTIVFRKDGREGFVDCVHAAVAELPAEEARDESRLVEFARTTEGKPVDLPPVEHFLALNSYVAGISDMGVKDLATASYSGEHDPERLTFGFNAEMQKQVAAAIREVDPGGTEDVAREIAYSLAESADGDWLWSRYPLLEETYKISDAICSDPELFDTWNGDNIKELKQVCTSKSNLPNEILKRLASDEDKDIRMKIANRLNLPNEVLEILASDEDRNIRITIAAYYNISDEKVLETLANDEDTYIRTIIARHSNLPDRVLEKLANDKDANVRFGVLNNFKVPKSLRDKLMKDKSVKELYVKRSNIPRSKVTKLINDKNPRIRMALAERYNLPKDVAIKLAHDDDARVRALIAKRRNFSELPETVINDLLNDENTRVRKEARNQINKLEALKTAGYVHPSRGSGQVEEMRLLDILKTSHKNSNRYKAAKKLHESGVPLLATVYEAEGPHEAAGDYYFRNVALVPASEKYRDITESYTEWTGYSGSSRRRGW